MMVVDNINLLTQLPGISTEKVVVENKSAQPFETFFKAYLETVDETNVAQIRSDNLQLAYAAGETDDLLSVQLAQQKAQTSLNFTVQVTNKIIEAYREIMRISM